MTKHSTARARQSYTDLSNTNRLDAKELSKPSFPLTSINITSSRSVDLHQLSVPTGCCLSVFKFYEREFWCRDPFALAYSVTDVTLFRGRSPTSTHSLQYSNILYCIPQPACLCAAVYVFALMSLRVQLDPPRGDVYTNLDFVEGRVILNLTQDATISSITVKLEGESKTKLDGPKSPQDQDRRKTLLEVHKLLYKVETVFPTPEVRETTASNSYTNYRTPQYTLLHGMYEYPFKFKIPFNSDCVNNTSLIKDLKVGSISVQYGQEPIHAKLALPPTLAGYPGEAEIRYFVKATVVQPKFYQKNIRNEVNIPFLPIEQPRPPRSDGETYGRRKHQFQKSTPLDAGRRKSFFRQNSNQVPEEEPLAFQLDARLPNPAIVICREPLPLRILIERLNNSASSLYLSMLQIELIGTTEVRAYDLQRKEQGTWTLISLANLSIPLEHPSNRANNWIVPDHFWKNLPLPSTIAPSFKTCNISRTYELVVRVGLAHGMADGVRPETIISEIKLDVDIWSGIAPPLQLLEAVQNHGPPVPNPTRLNIDTKDARPSLSAQQQQYPTPVTPQRPSSAGQPQYSPPAGRPSSSNQNYNAPPDDLPPSYEDAIAADLAPADGPRPSGYNTAEDALAQPAFNPDSKSSLGRRVSERLFSSNAPRAPGSTRSGRVASGDMSRFGGDVVPEEPDELTRGTQRMNIQESEAEERPPLPVRKPTNQYSPDPSSPGGYGKKQAEV